MNYPKVYGLLAVWFLQSFTCQSQSQNESNAPIIYQQNIQGADRTIRSGTFSNRTTNGANNYTEPKTWTYHPMTSWNSRFYGGKTLVASATAGGSMAVSSNILTSSGNFFVIGDVGRTVEVIGAGPSGTLLSTTITGITSATEVTLAATASTAVIRVIVHVGDATKPAYTQGHYTTYSNGNYELNYRLLFPANYSEAENYKYPMIVFLHGAGERGNCWGGNCFSNAGLLTYNNVTSTSGSGSITVPGANFTANDLNKIVRINFGGSIPNPINVDSRITAVSSSTIVVLADNASFGSLNRTFTIGYGANNQYRNNDLNLVHGGQVHLEGVYNPTTGSNGKKAEDPTLHQRAWPGFVFIPQNQDGWAGASQYEQAWRTIDLLISRYNIDPDRIYIHGLSNGGSATWEVLNVRADLFAGILPMSATISSNNLIFNAQVQRAVPIPSWIFQGGTDTNPTPNETRQIVAKLRNAGASVKYTVYPTTGHGTWGPAYNEGDFFSWMLRQNKRNINVLYGDSTLCGTNNSGVKLALGVGFLAYQWELDGSIISGAISNQYTGTQPGTYRARFSRISATPTPEQWNQWSKPVVIRQSPPATVTITAQGTSHLPDINGGNSVTLSTTVNSLTKNWYRDILLTTNPTNIPPIDTASTIIRTQAGKTTLKTLTTDGCASLESNPIYVTLATPISITAPSNLQAVVTSPSSAQLSWTDNSLDETNFELYRATDANGPYNFFQLLPQGAVSYTNTGLSPTTPYFYKVRAVNNTAASNYTANTSLTTEPDTQAPTAPQNVIVAERGLTNLVLSWTVSTDNTGIGSYTIETGTGTFLGTTGSALNEFVVSGLTPNTNYTYRVRAVDLAGNISQPSAQLVTSTTFTGLNYSHSAAFANVLTDGSNNWNDPEQTGTRTNFLTSPRIQDTFFNFKFEGYISLPSGTYDFRTISDDGSAIYLGDEGAISFPFSTNDFAANRIYNNDGVRTNNCRNNDGGNPFPGYSFLGTSFRPITVLMFQQEYSSCLSVQYRTSSSGPWTNIPVANLTSGTAPALVPPAIPTGLIAGSPGMSSINLNWNIVLGAEYEIYRSTNNVTYTSIARATTNSFTDNALNPSTLYYYKLKSVNSNGSSGFSSVVSATTAADTVAPSTPQNVTIPSSSYTNVVLTWNDCTDNVAVAGYRIYANNSLIGTSVNNAFYTTALLPSTFYALTVSAIDTAPTPNESLKSTPVNITTNSPLTFYSKPSSDLTQLSSWAVNTDGTGALPTSFNFDGQYFTVQNTQTLSASLTIGGSVSRVIVGDGVTLNIAQPLAGQLRVGNNSIVNINVDFQPSFENVSASSTVNFNTYTAVPAASYGNLTLNGSGLKNIGAGTLTVNGDLSLANGVGLRGSLLNGTTISILGNLNTGATTATASSDNRVVLQFTANATHNINVTSNQFISRIVGNTNSTIVFNNTSGSPKDLNLGTLNGGGIDLATGSTLVLGSNNLTFTGKAAVNPTNNTGKISINNGDISLTTSATTDANFYFFSENNVVKTFTLQSEANGITRIREAVDITNAIKINRGTFNANGFVTLKSIASSTASIQQIVNGSITGNVKVERYVVPKRVYRYISSPVANVTVANWQVNFPITGNFTGASTGPGLTSNPSMFDYNETRGGGGNAGYLAYPLSTTTNTAPILVGRGYAAFILEGTVQNTWFNTGVPNQGNISFTLTGTASPSSSTGWNLLGNPYASDIVWSNTGWTSSGVSNIIYVRENLVGGGFAWRTWDRVSNIGLLTNGQIPAGQAFWVQTTSNSPSLQVTEAAKTALSATNNTNFYRSENDAPNYLFSISINNGTYQDHAYVKLTDEGTDAYDKIRDGFKNKNSFFNVSTNSVDGVDLAVNDLGNSFCDKTIPVNLATINPGTYILQFNNLDNFSLANLKLIDAFTNTTTTISDSNPQYTITVTADVASYQNRLLLQLTRPSIVTNNALATQKDVFCRSEESVLVEIRNSQAGVVYEALSASNSVLSSQVLGNGETIKLAIPVKDLVTNQNTIRVRSSFPGCSSIMLANSKIISISELPTLTTQSSISACLGSPFDLTAIGTGTKYQWENASSNQVLSETSGTLRISVVNPINAYQVTALNPNGCKGVSSIILVRADSLDVPVISMTEGILKTNATQALQWLLDGAPIGGANNMELEPTSSGSYSLQAKSTYCTRVSAPYLVTAIDDSGNQPFVLTVFPNPSESGHFTVKGNSSSTASLQMTVIDMLGQELAVLPMSMEDYTKGMQLQQKLAAGVYLVRVIQNNKSVYQKVVIR